MKALIFSLLVLSISCEFLVTKEYTEYLKKHVSWEVEDYETNIFKGWSLEEAKHFLGAVEPSPSDKHYSIPSFELKTPLPSEISWRGSSCSHPVRDQGGCGSCWAFGMDGMLSDRCCMYASDHGALSTQELVSCDRRDGGCGGGWPMNALQYVIENKGLIHDACFPYAGQNVPCPNKCADGKDWKTSHVCQCVSPQTCQGEVLLKGCLMTGPVEVVFGVCQSFFSYRSGIYHCDCDKKYVGWHAVAAVGYGFSPECHYVVRNSWSANWGDQGYFKMGCTECAMDGHDFSDSNVMCFRVNN